MALKKTPLKQSLGKQIKELRLSAGWNQMEMAVKLGISQSHVSYWETGLSMPDSRYLEILCKEFGVELKFISTAKK